MKKTIAGLVAAAAFCMPAAVFADDGQLISLYQQLIQLLQQEIQLLQQNILTISPVLGKAPLTVTFTLNRALGTEAIDFGDGHSTGSSGCPTNAQGYCDLSKPITHVYQFPGTYKVTVYRGQAQNAQVIVTQFVTVQ
jgi:hypothetical protein